MTEVNACVTCSGAGELATENGPVDCPDCGGSGSLPSRAIVTDWRCRDIGRALAKEQPLTAQDGRWLLAELNAARGALTDIIALAHDIRDDDQIAMRIRMTASRAIGLYQTIELSSAATGPARTP